MLLLGVGPAGLALLASPWPHAARTVGARVPHIKCCSPPRQEPPSPPRTKAEEEAAPSPPTAKQTFSDDWSGAGRYADDDPLPLSFWLLGPNRRRGVLTSLAIWGLIAPATNLWGTGSFLLSLSPDAARQAKLDTFYPVATQPFYPYSRGYLDYEYGGFKRYVDDPGQRFEFRYPATYVQDQAVFMRNQEAAYSQRMMDPTLAATPAKLAVPRRKQQGVAVAFGPEGGTGGENLSVVIGAIEPGFTLRGALGPPMEAAERLLAATIAKQSVVDSTTLLDAFERPSARSGLPLYQFAYRVQYVGGVQKPSYTVCVVGTRDGQLYTFASRVPATVWEEKEAALREVASSFVLS